MEDFSEGRPPHNLPSHKDLQGDSPVSWSSLPVGQSVGVIVPVQVGRTVAPQAGVGVTTVPLLEASGQKEAGRWG